jgi:hypothetical protein
LRTSLPTSRGQADAISAAPPSPSTAASTLDVPSTPNVLRPDLKRVHSGSAHHPVETAAEIGQPDRRRQCCTACGVRGFPSSRTRKAITRKTTRSGGWSGSARSPSPPSCRSGTPSRSPRSSSWT